MKRGGRWSYAILVLAGSFVGGTFSSSLLHSKAYALWPAKAKHHKELTADKIAIVDSTGRQRIVLQVSDKGSASIALYDQNQVDRAELHVHPDGAASLAFYNQNGNKRLAMGESAGGNVGVGIFDPSGKQLAGLAEMPSHDIGLTLFDPQSGRARAGLGVSRSGAPALVMFDQNGVDRAELYIKNGKPGLALADESGKTIGGLPASNQ